MQIQELMKNGIIILDKWKGPTSRDVCNLIKKTLGLRKVGHAGTLDPNVSGVLLITLENACKITPVLQGLDKEYIGTMHLHKDVDDEKLRYTIKKFVGEILQKPPVRSAVSRKERKRKIYSIEILSRIGRDVNFRVSCEAGTYIRKLISDIGKHIGGAHMKELRRIRVGSFDENMAIKIEDLLDAYHSWKENRDERIRNIILPIESAVKHLKKIIIKDSAIYSITHGSPLYAGGISKIEKGISKDEMIAIFSLKNELIAIGRANMNGDEMLGKRLAVKINRVIMEKGIYQK